jgi:hypothetical protein
VTRRTGILAATLGLLVLVGGIVFLWHRGRIDPLPPSVRQPVEDERMARARVDSQLVAATEEARAAQERQDSATTRALLRTCVPGPDSRAGHLAGRHCGAGYGTAGRA